MLRIMLLPFLALMACAGDQTISAFADPGASYRLIEINGAPFPATATISFPEKGTIRGRGPCNTYSAKQTAPYPWFEPGPVVATRMACADLAHETRFLATLASMSLAEISGDTLILRDDADAQMVFRAETHAGK